MFCLDLYGKLVVVIVFRRFFYFVLVFFLKGRFLRMWLKIFVFMKVRDFKFFWVLGFFLFYFYFIIKVES